MSYHIDVQNVPEYEEMDSFQIKIIVILKNNKFIVKHCSKKDLLINE